MRHETEVSGPLHAPAALLPGVETPTPVEWTADCVPELVGTPYDICRRPAENRTAISPVFQPAAQVTVRSGQGYTDVTTILSMDAMN